MPGAARLRGFVEHSRPARAARRRPTCRSSRADFTYAAAVPAVEALLAQATPDAIMCANDLLAVAAINVLRRRGRSVPDDVAVVGMDDTDIAELVSPTLTSVDLGAARRAATAAELLLDRLGDADARRPAASPSRRRSRSRVGMNVRCLDRQRAARGTAVSVAGEFLDRRMTQSSPDGRGRSRPR